jgi:predicted outer membrane protein
LRKFATSVGICLLISLSGPAFAAPDAKTFVTDAITATNGLIKLGSIGQAKGRATTQSFSVRMGRDTFNAKHDLATLADTLGVTPPDGFSAEVTAEMTTLARTSDETFDAEFGGFLVKVLTAEIAEFQAVADAKSGPASELAAAQLPMLQKTLDGAKRVAR